jgi:hypothetical protein
MKNLLFLFTIAFLAFSCATPQAVRESKGVMKGEWVLNSITYSESGSYNITIFSDSSKDCFEGSAWKFIPNNNTGVYTIGSAGCRVGDRHFIFTIQEIDAATGYYDFLLKPTDERGRSETNQGFRVRLAYLTDTMMTWQQNLTVDGRPFTLNMNFTKI